MQTAITQVSAKKDRASVLGKYKNGGARADETVFEDAFRTRCSGEACLSSSWRRWLSAWQVSLRGHVACCLFLLFLHSPNLMLFCFIHFAVFMISAKCAPRDVAIEQRTSAGSAIRHTYGLDTLANSTPHKKTNQAQFRHFLGPLALVELIFLNNACEG